MMSKEKAWTYVDEHFDEMLSELGRACACPSTADDPEGREAMRLCLLDDMRRSGLSPTLHPVEGGNALISAELRGDAPDTLLFYNHYDVVEPGKAEHWSNKAPFQAEIRDGRIYARGVSDNKGGLYCRIHAIRAMVATNGRLPVGIKFLAEGDEEISSPSMIYFAEECPDEFRELTRADICLWENGRVDAANRPYLCCGVRGSMAFDLRVTTASSDVHGRMGATVPSASWRLVWALSTLKSAVDERVTIKGFYEDVLPTTEADLQALRDFPYDEESLRRSLHLEHFVRGASGEALKRQMYLEPTLSICGLEAGEVHNGVRGIVPHTAYGRISFYLVADQDPDDLEAKLRRHLSEHGFPDVEVTRCSSGTRAVRTSSEHPFRFRACEVAKEVFPGPMIVELTQLGAGPAAVFRKAWPYLPIFGLGPANITGNHHAPNENLGVEDYRRAIKYLIALCYSYEKKTGLNLSSEF